MLFTLNWFLFSTLISAFLFHFVICPLDPTSKGIRLTTQPILSKSTFRSLYFLVSLIWADSIFFSKLHVNSSNSICLWFLFIKTMSGLKLVARISGGIVPPNVLTLLTQQLLKRQQHPVFSSNVTSAVMKVLLTKELGNMSERNIEYPS